MKQLMFILPFISIGLIFGGAKLTAKLYYLDMNHWNSWEWYVALIMWALALTIAEEYGKLKGGKNIREIITDKKRVEIK